MHDCKVVKACWSHKNHTTTIFTLSHLKDYNITYWNYYNEFLHNMHTWNGPFSHKATCAWTLTMGPQNMHLVSKHGDQIVLFG